MEFKNITKIIGPGGKEVSKITRASDGVILWQPSNATNVITQWQTWNTTKLITNETLHIKSYIGLLNNFKTYNKYRIVIPEQNISGSLLSDKTYNTTLESFRALSSGAGIVEGNEDIPFTVTTNSTTNIIHIPAVTGQWVNITSSSKSKDYYYLGLLLSGTNTPAGGNIKTMKTTWEFSY